MQRNGHDGVDLPFFGEPHGAAKEFRKARLLGVFQRVDAERRSAGVHKSGGKAVPAPKGRQQPFVRHLNAAKNGTSLQYQTSTKEALLL